MTTHENIKTTLPITLDWSAADVAYTGLRDQYIAFCIALGRLSQEGATQHQIAERYDISQASVAKAIAIGRDERIIRSANNLPKSQETLYLLSTLNDTDFKAHASPDTTRQKVLDSIGKGKAPANPSDKRSDTEVARLKAELAVSEAEVDKYLDRCIEHENEIERLKAEIDALKAEIEALKAALKAADNLVKAADKVVKVATTPKPKPVKVKASKPVKAEA